MCSFWQDGQHLFYPARRRWEPRTGSPFSDLVECFEEQATSDHQTVGKACRCGFVVFAVGHSAQAPRESGAFKAIMGVSTPASLVAVARSKPGPTP